ncbi:MAG: hypothetical protein ACJ79S_15395 [Gemmatimonadaceae bacterium]
MTRLPALHPKVVALAIALAGAAGCASRPAAAPASGDGSRPAPAAAPLAAVAGERIVLVPAQRLRDAGALGWLAEAGSPATYLANLDDEIAFALADRGVGRGWVMPRDVVRSARRNPTFATDPHALGVAPLLPGARAPRGGEPLAEPLASELRTVVALGDARYVLVPVELRFERVAAPASAGGITAPGAAAASGRAILRLALVDARAAKVRWSGDVASDPAPRLSPALAAGVAGRVADLVAPR